MTGASIADPSAGRIRFALYMRGACLFRLGRKEEAEESLRQGAQTAKNPGDRLECLQYLADILAASGKYEKPYRIAAKIFFFVGQYEDAVSVFERARENGVAFGPELRLYEIKTRRKRKPSKEEHGKLLKDCQALAEELEKEAEPDGQNPDFRDSRPEAQRELLGEVCCTLGLLYWDEKKADAAVRAMADAIRISPANVRQFCKRPEKEEMALIIGIDLGTTNSLAAYYTDQGPKIIPNRLGKNLTPSVVSIDENDQIYVGETAKERMLLAPESTAAVFKRDMGSKKEFRLLHKTFTAEELSSFVLRALKEDAESFLGCPVEEAVISVPTAAAVAYGLYSEQRGRKVFGI